MNVKPLLISLLVAASCNAFALNDAAVVVAVPDARSGNSTDEQSLFDGAVERARAATSNLIVHAMGLVGINYRYGGSSPDAGFDCSGFVAHVFKEAAGVTLPHNAYRMSLAGQKIAQKELKPGDLVFFNTLKRAFSHVGIYIGDNKFVHAPSTGKQVQVANLGDSYWTTRFEGARRIPDVDQPATTTAANGPQSESPIPVDQLF